MINILLSDEFDRWLMRLNDLRARARITARLRSAALGHFGDVQSVGEGVFEMRVHYGPGYRLYYKRSGETVYLMLAGGDKGSQKRDIRRAVDMARALDKDGA